MNSTIPLIITFLTILQTLAAQTPPGNIQIANHTAATQPIPTHLLYRHFLAWVNALDKKANLAGISDPYKSAEPFAKHAGLEDSQIDIIRTEAQSLEDDLANHKTKVAPLIRDFRAQAKLAAEQGTPMPPIPTQIAELQQERDTLIKSHISILKAALGPDVSARLDQYLTREIAPHVSLSPIAVPHTPAVPGTEVPFK